MKTAYHVIITEGKKFLISYVPDLQINTQGKNLADIIEMSRDAISLWIVSAQKDGTDIPKPSDLKSIEQNDGEILTLVDINTGDYQKKINKVIRRSARVYKKIF